VKKSATTLLLLSVSTAFAFAATPQQPGAWSIYTANGNLNSHRPVLLQTASEEQYRDASGNPVRAKLDVICNNGKVAAIALEPNFAIQPKAISFSGAVPTTRVTSFTEGQNVREDWEVLDHGRALSPYSEVLPGRMLRSWAGRISAANKMAFQLTGSKGEAVAEPTFQTGQLSEALSSVGCRY
jgi:hypothetical protein